MVCLRAVREVEVAAPLSKSTTPSSSGTKERRKLRERSKSTDAATENQIQSNSKKSLSIDKEIEEIKASGGDASAPGVSPFSSLFQSLLISLSTLPYGPTFFI